MKHLALKITVCYWLLSSVVDCKGAGSKIRKNKKQKEGSGIGRNTGGTSSGSKDGTMASYDFYGLPLKPHRNLTHEERLLAYLFRDYDPVARAVVDTDKPVDVYLAFVLLRIHGLDERSQVLTTTGLVIAEWNDGRLEWNPQDFGNLSEIVVKADKIWLPEIAVMNGADELNPDFERIRVLLNHRGELHWEPGGIFRTTCDIDIQYFPFDSQACPMLIGAYSYHSDKMNISTLASEISTHDFRLNGEWQVAGTAATRNETILDISSGKGYAHVVFMLYLKRRYQFYMMNIVLPCLMLSALIMIGFFLPPEAGEKISLGISVLLAFTVFLLMVADNIPRTSLAIPLLVLYLTATMTLGTLSVCLTVFVLNIHHRNPRFPVRPLLRTAILRYLAKVLRIRTTMNCTRAENRVYIRSGSKNGRQEDNNGLMVDEVELLSLTKVNHNKGVQVSNGPKNSKNSLILRRTEIDDELTAADYSQDWHELAMVLDRFFFWCLFIAMSLSAVFILLYPKYMGLENKQIGESDSILE